MRVETFAQARAVVRRAMPFARIANYGAQDATHRHVPAWDAAPTGEVYVGTGPLLVAKADGAITMLGSVPPWDRLDAMERVGVWPR